MATFGAGSDPGFAKGGGSWRARGAQAYNGTGIWVGTDGRRRLKLKAFRLIFIQN